MNTLYEKRYISFVGACLKTAPSQGYTICKYVNWIGMQGRIGDKNNYRKHLHMFLSKAHFYNLSRFRLGAWKLNVNNINLKHINRSRRFCNYCTDNNNNRRLVTLAEHTSDHGRQTNSSTEEKGEQV